MSDERKDEIAELCGRLRGALPLGQIKQLAEDAADRLERLLWEVERLEGQLGRETRVVAAALDHSIPDGLRLWDILQEKAGAWHVEHFPEDDDPRMRMAKLFEEGGELARAIIAERERRPDRGEIGQEAAQTVLVVMSTLGRFYPQVSLLRQIITEMIDASAIELTELPWK